METIGDITVEHSAPESVVVYIKQDDDVVAVYRDEIDGLADALREYSPLTCGEPKPAPEENVVNGVDLRITRIIARVKIQQLRRDAAYEEGRISAIDSILED